MDEFGCFDAKKPPGLRAPDWRTSTYRGHRYITDTRLGSNLSPAPDCSKKISAIRGKLMDDKQLSEVNDKYTWKFSDPNVLRNPSLNMKVQFMKRYEEGKLRFLQRNMKPISSVTQDTYTFNPLPSEAEPLSAPLPTPVEPAKIVIDRAQHGYTKYLDPTATTYNLSYVHRTPAAVQASIAAHDNITFWNWTEHAPTSPAIRREPDETMCDESAAKDCPKRRLEYPTQLKRVPHTGLISEVQANYVHPQQNKECIEYDMTDVKPILVHEAVTPFPKQTEYTIYGSGQPVVKYV